MTAPAPRAPRVGDALERKRPYVDLDPFGRNVRGQVAMGRDPLLRRQAEVRNLLAERDSRVGSHARPAAAALVPLRRDHAFGIDGAGRLQRNAAGGPHIWFMRWDPRSVRDHDRVPVPLF